MATATERVPVLMSPAEKQAVIAKAKRYGLTTGEFMRRAADGYELPADEEALSAMIDEMNKATASAEKEIDSALRFVTASNKRIAKMEAEAKQAAT